MPKPETQYIAKVFHRKDGDATRSVVSFDKREQIDGQWTNIKAKKLVWEDGTELEFSGPTTFKLLDEPMGNFYATIFQNIWPEKKADDDSEIPF